MRSEENIFLIQVIKRIIKAKTKKEQIDFFDKKGLKDFFRKKTIRQKTIQTLLNPKKEIDLNTILDLWDEQGISK